LSPNVHQLAGAFWDSQRRILHLHKAEVVAEVAEAVELEI